MSRPLILTFVLFSLLPLSVRAELLTIATAANFFPTLQKLAETFESDTSHELRLVSGSSGKLYAQVLNGAPYDLFLSADQQIPAALVREQLAVANSQSTYAIGELVLWTARGRAEQSFSELLKDLPVRKIALANPALAPYGQAAAQTMESLELADSLAAKLVYGENIAQTYQFAWSGNVQAAFLAKAQLIAQDRPLKGLITAIPEDYYRPLRQDMVVLQRGADKVVTQQFLRFLRSDSARATLRAQGYRLAARPAGEEDE